MKTAIITGITGQDGAYLAKLLLENNYKVIGTTRTYKNNNLNKLNYLNITDQLTIEECDLTDITSIVKLLQTYHPDEIYNLAAQSSVGLSFEQPIGTIRFNIISVLNLLESIRLTDNKIKFYQASSSEMFGKVDNLPITETTPMHPLSPYAISKASAYWTVVNYRESYNLFAVNGVLFNHESYLRSNNFFIKKVIRHSLAIARGEKEYLEVGNIDINRDFGFAPAYVKAMWLMLQHSTPDDFMVCSGQSVSLKEIIHYIFNKLNISRDKLIISQKLFRPTDIPDIYGDNTKIKTILKWEYDFSFFNVLDLLIDEEMKNI